MNFWKHEGRKRPFWKYAKEFFEKCEDEDAIIYYTGFILKELKLHLKHRYYEKRKLFDKADIFVRVVEDRSILREARKMESELNFSISFYDIIHMIYAKKYDATLITRDRKLIKTAKRYKISVKNPEEIL